MRALLLCLLAGSAAADHLASSPGVTRWLQIDITANEVRLRSTLYVGNLAAPALRKRVGQLDAEGRRALRVELAEELNRALSLRLDGATQQPRWEAPSLSLSGETFTLEQSGSLALAGHLLDVEDRSWLAPMAAAEMRFSVPADFSLEVQSNGKAYGEARLRRWSAPAAGEARRLTLSFARKRPLPWRRLAGGALFALGAALLWIGRRRAA